jgi:tRNA(Ile)-lysidine synthase
VTRSSPSDSSPSEAALRRSERRVAGFVAAHGLLTERLRVLLLLSGGADSMALLELVRRCGATLGFDLTLGALHVDYAMRGADSRRDSGIVERACAVAGVPLEVVTLDKRLSGPDFQERARRLRLGAARRLLTSGDYDVVATGHNLDDQAETVLYRLVKYGAPSALVGMPPRAGRMVRPLLCLRAAEVRAYCHGRGIVYGDDVTNQQQTYARNVIRLAAVPQLERLNPRAVESLAAAADAAREQQELLAQLADSAWLRVTVPDVGAAEQGARARPGLDLRLLALEPPALRTLLLRRLAALALGDDALLERRVTQALVELAGGSAGTRRVRLRDGWEAVREYDRIWLRRGAARQEPSGPGAASCACAPVPVHVPAPPDGTAEGEEISARVCGRRFALRRVAGCLPRELVGRIALGGDRPVGALTLRHPRAGDRFAPMGLGAETSVARFLREQKVPLALRPRVLVIESDGRVAWVELPGGRSQSLPGGSGPVQPGGRVAESFRVAESSILTVLVREQAHDAS